MDARGPTRRAEQDALISRRAGLVVSVVLTVLIVSVFFTPLGDARYGPGLVALVSAATLVVAVLLSNPRGDRGRLRHLKMLATGSGRGALGGDMVVTAVLRLGFLASLFSGVWVPRPASYALVGSAFAFLFAERMYRARIDGRP